MKRLKDKDLQKLKKLALTEMDSKSKSVKTSARAMLLLIGEIERLKVERKEADDAS